MPEEARFEFPESAQRLQRSRSWSDQARNGDFEDVFAGLARLLDFTVAARTPKHSTRKPVPPPGDHKAFAPVIREALEAGVGWALCGYRAAMAGVSNTETAVLLGVKVPGEPASFESRHERNRWRS